MTDRAVRKSPVALFFIPGFSLMVAFAAAYPHIRLHSTTTRRTVSDENGIVSLND